VPMSTTCEISNLPPGTVKFTLRLRGYEEGQVTAVITPEKLAFKDHTFVARPGPRKGQPWENSLKMTFVPVGDLLVGTTPVRLRDFAAYSVETGRARLAADFPQDENHPVVRVNWTDATEFCKWLTQHEIAAGKLNEGQVYRLPTDLEWSTAAGIADESGNTPERRDGIVRDFPWGKTWPPPTNPSPGNYGDTALRQAVANQPRTAGIADYNDGFAYTSPVGAFPANKFGLFDMSGNVWQWVADSYNASTKDWGVLRGGSWGSVTADELRLGYRNVVSKGERDVIFGFRCVLVPEP
jgi:formylglycine-generating enzyme required for sulfatase activity